MINFSLLDEAFPNEDKTSIKKKNKKDVKDVDKPKEIRDCSPIQAPIYEIPNTCDNKQVFTNVINDSMKNDYINNNNYKNDGIKNFDFDEMDAYLNVTNINTNNSDRSPEYRTTPFLIEYLKSLRDNINADKTLNIEQFSNHNNSLKIDNNLILFMFMGIIIILLIDQITKLAIAIKS
jgi:hypothetical protein